MYIEIKKVKLTKSILKQIERLECDKLKDANPLGYINGERGFKTFLFELEGKYFRMNSTYVHIKNKEVIKDLSKEEYNYETRYIDTNEIVFYFEGRRWTSTFDTIKEATDFYELYKQKTENLEQIFI